MPSLARCAIGGFPPLWRLREVPSVVAQARVSPSGATGELVRALGTSATALGGGVRPKRFGRKSTTGAATPDELGSLHRTARSV
ncbi:hypothetical protein [Brasilonema sp. UFV-L1]|uniref:hypothetical protein n=1 Tax=Brasilonema sp. UFV-L1 TaxID=2234130 RepID=UPI00145E498D|nr:hypothetical protein [Brasilonema sp. UFV-L1]